MKTLIRITAGTGAAAFALAGGLAFGVGTASAANPTVPFSDPQAVGGLILENASGQVVTSGSLADDPTFPIVVGNNPAIRTTDDSAVLNIATPVSTQTPQNYYSDQLQPAYNYTAGGVPTNVGSQGGGLTLGQYIGLDSGRNPSTDSYANLYELRLVPGTNGVGADATYYTAVISVTEGPAASDGSATGTWTLVSTATNTVLSTPSSSSTAGSPVTVTATTTPAAAGTVTFKEGSKTLGTGTTDPNTGIATLSTTFTAGVHKIISSYVPTVPTSVDPSTSQTLTYTSVAPVTPPASLPEAPYALLLPLLGGTIGAVVIVRRRATV